MSSIGNEIFEWRSSKKLNQNGLAKLHELTFKDAPHKLSPPLISLIENDILRPGPELERQLRSLIGSRT